MTHKTVKVVDIFQESVCNVCGIKEINQHFNVNENYVGYCGVFIPLREIVSESLGLTLNYKDGRSMEICLDCKDKVVNFFQFKRKIKDAQKAGGNGKTLHARSKFSENTRNKIVKNICEIIENYTEKCSVTSIRVNEGKRRLIIEGNDDIESENDEQDSENETEMHRPRNIFEEPIFIKAEPEDKQEITFNDEDTEDSDDYWGDFSQRKNVSTASAVSMSKTRSSGSSAIGPPAKKIKCTTTKKSSLNLTKLGATTSFSIPVINEDELNLLDYELTNNEDFETKLGQELIQQTKKIEAHKKGNTTIIRNMIKTLIGEEICSQMNMTGKVNAIIRDECNLDRMIKAPDSIVALLAKCTSMLSSGSASEINRDVKRTISRGISDRVRDRKRRVNN